MPNVGKQASNLEEHRGSPQVADSGAVAAEAVRSALERILASRGFQGSQALSRFLCYTVDQTLEGHTDRLKEYTIGVDVLGRTDDFDPRTDAIVRIQASRLRAKLGAYYQGEGASDSIRIELPRGSYVPAFHPAPRESPPPRARGHWKAAGFATTALLMIGSVWWLKTASAARNADSREALPTHIAVLPFVNLDNGADTEHLGDEMTSELMNTLARMPGLHLVGRSSAFQFKGRNVDARQIGRELNVGAVVEGTLRTSGSRRRVTAQLVSARDGFQLWSQTFERSVEDGFAIQDDVARGVARALDLPPPGDSTVAFWNRRSRDPEAYNFVLKARYLEPTTEDTATTRIGYYRAAIDRDPGYAAAWIGMADTWCRLAGAGAQAPREVKEKAREAVTKALELDETLPEAHFLAAVIHWTYDWDWVAADREFQRANELDPSSATTRSFYAQYLSHMGRFDEAFAQLELLRKLQPVAAEASGFEANVLYLSRRYDRAIPFCESVLARNASAWPLYYWLGRAYGSTGRLDEAVAALEKLHPSGEVGGRGFGMLGATYALAGRQADALKLLEQLRERTKRAYVSPVSVAQIYLGLGDRDRAFEWLKKGYRDRDETMTALKVEPAYDLVRDDSRFRALLRRLNLE